MWVCLWLSLAGAGTLDSDFDGVPDSQEYAGDTDNNGVLDYLDPDDDGDGIPTFDEGSTFVECMGPDDGVPPYLDDDSDGDGVSDEVEGFWDEDVDGIPNFLDCNSFDGPAADVDADGVVNRVEWACAYDRPNGVYVLGEGTACPGYECLDHTAADSDGDGLLDGIEMGADHENPVDSDEDGIMDVCDEDDDNDTALTVDEVSIPDPDGDCIAATGCTGTAPDQDGDLKPNHLDLDDDADGVSTRAEDPNGNGDPHDDDTDWDGHPNYLDDAESDGPCGDPDEDGLPTWVEQQLGSDPDVADTDQDTLTDLEEYGSAYVWDADTATTHCDQVALEDSPDTDGDGNYDVADADDDNDGIPTSVEVENSALPNALDHDTDGDGTPDHLDLDSDGDGLDDALEGATDDNGDGVPNYLEPYEGEEIEPPETSDASCGCQTPGSVSSLWWLAGVGLMLRRRSRTA